MDDSMEPPEELELPSCLESLLSSGHQLRSLAESIGQYYTKSLLIYAYACEPPSSGSQPTSGQERNKSAARRPSVNTSEPRGNGELASLADNRHLLAGLDSLLNILPLLQQLNTALEGSAETLKSTLKRSAYYLNKAAQVRASKADPNHDFLLPPNTKLNGLFVPIMDLIYALASLEAVLQNHTNIRQDLESLKSICQLVSQASELQLSALAQKDPNLAQLPEGRLEKLLEHLESISIALCQESLFQQLLEDVSQLSFNLELKKFSKLDKTLDEHLWEFILFYQENLLDCELEWPSAPKQPNNQNHLTSKLLVALDRKLNGSLYLASRSVKTFALVGLILLYVRLFKRQHNKKSVQRIMLTLIQRNRSLSLVPLLNSNSHLNLVEFLIRNLPEGYIDAPRQLRQLAEVAGEALANLDLAGQYEQFQLRLSAWALNFKWACRTGASKELLGELFREGLSIERQVSAAVRLAISLYMHLERPISRLNLIYTLRLAALSKAVEATLEEGRARLDACLAELECESRAAACRLLGSIQKRLLAMRFSERKLDTNSMLLLTSQCASSLRLAPEEGRALLAMALPMLIPSLEAVEAASLLELVANLEAFPRARSEANFGFLYWNIPTFGNYYQHAFEESGWALNELKYFLRSLADIKSLFSLPERPSKSQFDDSALRQLARSFLAKLEAELVDQFKRDLVDKVCQEFEMELRLQTHRDLNLEANNLLKRHHYNFKQIFYKFSLDPQAGLFRILSSSISLKEQVEQHLNRISYNLTAIAPNDWFTYDRMLNLASRKYRLSFLNSQLPTQALDCGLDLLAITRNLALFVSRYSYDLTSQTFVEKCSVRSSSSASIASSILSSNNSAQNLNVIQVKHISKSIQTHGFGLLNSSVNCVYQLLKRLVNLLAKQLSDDRLRALLVKEHHQLISNAANHRKLISLERVNRMAKKLRPLPAAAGGDQRPLQADLDSLRQLLTQLGNLLGLVRMLKVASLHLASSNVEYLLPEQQQSSSNFQRLASSEFSNYLNAHNLLEAARNFDLCLEDFNANFLSKTNYLKIILDTFAKILSSGPECPEAAAQSQEPAGSGGTRMEQLHLFYLLVPALTANFVDYITNCKERISSRSSSIRFGGLLADDGFPMGVAFLLSTLEQRAKFAQLNWFQEVVLELEANKPETSAKLAAAQESPRKFPLLTAKRYDKLIMEYNCLKYSLNASLLFMKD